MSMTAIVPARRRLERISSRAWEHPADRAALAALRAIPGFDEALKKVVGSFGERGTRLAFQADAVRVGPRQFPRLHHLWQRVHETLDAPEPYDLYVSQSPFVNAGAFGFDKPWVVLFSGSLRTLTDAEVEFVMGHEMGHVLSGHAIYHTMLVLLIRLARSAVPMLGVITTPLLMAASEWFRKSELSGDRAGLLAMQVPDAAMSAMMRLAGGGTPEEMDLNEFLVQAEEYRRNSSVMDEVMKVLNTLGMSHPFLVMRAALLRDWIQEGAYDRILRGEYPRRDGAAPSWQEDAGAAARYYADGAQGAAGKAGEALRRMREALSRGYGSPAG